MLYLLAIVALVVGLVIGLVGFAAAADPEGRVGNLVLLIYLGSAIVAIAAGWLLWMGCIDLWHLVQMPSH
ncbi:MAG: hypothetical protein Q8K91_12770 [Hylemonella sp.]|nr:hypothetical protein [Hylemonella sp.]MDP1938071.1 hypothetical protein [Hylemonella sp.]